MGSYVKPGKRKMETLIPEAVKAQEESEVASKRAKTSADVDNDSAMKE